MVKQFETMIFTDRTSLLSLQYNKFYKSTLEPYIVFMFTFENYPFPPKKG